jgi:hypothetical protein
MATRCSSPPDNSLGMLASLPARPTEAIAARDRALQSCSDTPRSTSGSATFFSSVRCGRTWKAWNTKPKCSRRSSVRASSSSFRRSLPSNSTLPSSEDSSPAITFSRVDLPVPDSPRIATYSPAARSSATPSNTVRVPKRLATPVSRSMTSRGRDARSSEPSAAHGAQTYMRRALALSLAMLPATAFAQQAPTVLQPFPRPDQKLEQAISVHVISQMDRAQQPEKTIPESATAVEPLAKIRDDLYIERRLLPRDARPPVATRDSGTFVALR